MKVNKLIVSRDQARKIRDNSKVTLGFDMRIKKSECKLITARKKFLNNVFWVAEPIRQIKNTNSKAIANQFACDKVPDGWVVYTLPRPGSRVDRTDSRHLVKCTNVQISEYGAGSMFTVFVDMEKLP